MGEVTGLPQRFMGWRQFFLGARTSLRPFRRRDRRPLH